jgi:hypothetical protein
MAMLLLHRKKRRKIKTGDLTLQSLFFFFSLLSWNFSILILFADAVDTATKEIGFFFPEFDIEKWEKDRKEQ